MNSLFIISIGVLLFSSYQAVSGFNCSNVFEIESDSGLLNYLGNVTFSAPKNSTGVWTLDMKTNVPFTFLGGWNVWISSEAELGLATFRSRDSELELVKGDRVTFRYRISWGRDEQKPIPVSLIWNDIQICA